MPPNTELAEHTSPPELSVVRETISDAGIVIGFTGLSLLASEVIMKTIGNELVSLPPSLESAYRHSAIALATAGLVLFSSARMKLETHSRRLTIRGYTSTRYNNSGPESSMQ